MSLPRLPNEIWADIFRRLPNGSLAQLLRVSRVWHDIVNDTPQLWTHIDIHHPHQFADPEGLAKWLNKSGQCLLHVSISVPSRSNNTDLELQPILTLLYDHVNRFRVFELLALKSELADTILTNLALSKTTPSQGNPGLHLEELRIVSIENVPSGFNYFEHAFDPAPCLSRLVLSPLSIPPPSSKLLSTITVLSLVELLEGQPSTVKPILDMITAMPLLKSFIYSADPARSHQHVANLNHLQIVQVPHLLAAVTTVPGCGFDILRHFEAPLLVFVRLIGTRNHEGEEVAVEGIVDHISIPLKLLPQRAPIIRILDLVNMQYLCSETFAWLLNQAEFVQLEELRMVDCPISDAALMHSGSPCPSLRRLRFCNCAAITGGALVHYIKRGRPIWAKDFELLVSGCPGVSERDLSRLSRLVNVRDKIPLL